MVKPQKQIKKRKKGAKKKFFDVKVPLTASNVKLYGYEAEELVGNVVKIDMTKNLRGKNLELRAKVKLQDQSLTADIISMRLIQSYLKKVMRRGTDYVEDSFDANTKDFKLKVKPFMITRNRVSRAVRREIRKLTKKFLEGHFTIRNSEEIFSEIMSNKLQKTLSQKVKKIYPLALCEIRVIEVVGPADVKVKKEKDVVEDKQ